MLRVGNFFVYGAVCALSSMLFVACGGDSASSSSGEDTRSVIDSLMEAYSITVENDKLVMSINDTVDKKNKLSLSRKLFGRLGSVLLKMKSFSGA